jgi:predicted MFS family arabinose efflux permease
MSTRSPRQDYSIFLALLIFSLIGNSCADFALIWHGLETMAPAESNGKSGSLTLFYVGQAVGVVVLAPIISVLTDRQSRLHSALALDALYSACLFALLLLERNALLTPLAVFAGATLMAALSILHKSSVAFSAVRQASESSGINRPVEKFIVALNAPILVGSALSGLIYRHFGFDGCILFGIASFAPMPVVYFRLFGKETPERRPTKRRYFSDLFDGIKALFSDRLLCGTAISIGILNMASAILPSVVAISFMDRHPGRTDYAAIAISASIFLSMLLTNRISKIARDWPMNQVLLYSILPASAALALCWYRAEPLLFALMFFLSCAGSVARNVSTGKLRVSRVPKDLTGRVNVAYSAILYVGQSLGGLFVVEAARSSSRLAVLAILGPFLLSAFVSWLILPNEKVSTLLETES